MAVNKLVSVLDPDGTLPDLVAAEIVELVGQMTILGDKVVATATYDDGVEPPETVTMSADELLQMFLGFYVGMSGVVNDLFENKAGIDPVTGKMFADLAPDISISDFKGEVASQAAMLAVVGENGDYVIRTDTNTMWTVVREPSNVLANWVQWRTPASPVQSVADRTGAVVLVATDITNSTPSGRAILTSPDYAAVRSLLGVPVIGNGAADAMRGDKWRVVSTLPTSPDPDLFYAVPE